MGKDMVVAIKQEANEGYAPRNIVDAFDDVIYARLDRQDTPTTTFPDDDDTPFGDADY